MSTGPVDITRVLVARMADELVFRSWMRPDVVYRFDEVGETVSGSTGTHDPELAQFVVAVITAIAIAFSSLMLADMAAERASGPAATARFRHQWWLPVVFTAAALTVVGEFGYNGNIDGFVACSFVGLALALLRRGSSVHAPAIVPPAHTTPVLGGVEMLGDQGECR